MMPSGPIRRLVLFAALASLGGCTWLFPEPSCSAARYSVVFEQATRGDVAAVRAALDRDPKLMTRTECSGATLLHDAVDHSEVAMAAFLLDRGAPIEAKTTLGMTPLHMAAQNGDMAMLTLLLGRGADANAVDAQGWTPLDRAMKWHHPVTADLLRAHGGRADPSG